MGQFLDDHDVRRPQEFPRLSERYPIPRLGATWYPPAGRRLAKGKGAPISIKIVDISVAGCLVEAPENSNIVVGSRIKIDFNGTEGVAEVRNIRDGESPGTNLFGVNYFRMSPAMQELVFAVVGKVRKDNNLSTVWERRRF